MKSRNFSLSHLLIFLFIFFEKRRETEIVTDTDDDVVVTDVVPLHFLDNLSQEVSVAAFKRR